MADAPQIHGTGEIRMESAPDCASGYFISFSDSEPHVGARTSGVYLRAEPELMGILDGSDVPRRSELIADRLRHWNEIRSA